MNERYQPGDETVSHPGTGGIAISATHLGRGVNRVYFGYTEAEARERFASEILAVVV